MNNSKQQGMSLIQMVLVLGILGVITLVGLQVFPLYYDKTVIAKVLDETAELADSKRMGRKQIWDTVSRNLQLNNIGYLQQDALEYRQGDNGETILVVNYEERRHLVGNLSLVVSFFHETDK
ncbi:MAG: DUF4845 domain-containing protein [bacterium]